MKCFDRRDRGDWRGDALASFRSFYWRQFSLVAGMVALTLFLLGTSFFSLTYNFIMQEKKSEMQEKAELVAQLSSSYLAGEFPNGRQDLQTLVTVAASLSETDFLIWNPQNRTLLTTDDSLDGMELSLPGKITQAVLEGESYSGMDDLNIYPSNRFVVAVPCYAPHGAVQGMVVAVTQAENLTEMWRGFLGIFGVTCVTVILITVVASSVTALQQTKPVRDMVTATRRFAEGDFDIRVQSDSGITELKELADSFNTMADSLQETERQRREFIANISHELKTPMTVISGYAEGILDGAIPQENEEQYLRIICDESQRLNRLVRRMLEVSQLQSMDLMKGKTPFDICESMRRVLISLERRINGRGLDVDAEIPEDPVMVLGDNDLITQVVYNLLENAVKFAAPGTALYLGLSVHQNKAIVTVRNYGSTIPPEELPRLFERFHKSDRSRSEDKDGVGLGLYIVKTILEQHHEEIRATSENGLTTFSFTVQRAGEMQLVK